MKGKKLPEKLEKKAYDLGTVQAYMTFGMEKNAFMAALGRGMQTAGKFLGAAPTGIGNMAGAAIGGIGGAVQGLAQGEGLKGALGRGAVGAASGALPMGAGMAVGMAGNMAMDKMVGPKPPMPGMR